MQSVQPIYNSFNLNSYNQLEPIWEENGAKKRILFSEFVLKYINQNNRPKYYKQSYINLLKHIEGYSRSRYILNVYTNSIGLEFCEGFVSYLKSLGLMTNTVKGLMEKLSAMLHKAVLYGYPVNNTFSEIKLKEEEPNPIFFDQNEIARLYYFKGLTKHQEYIRDLYIVGCCTGLRYSDYSRLNGTHFVNYGTQIQIKTIKTGSIVKVPVHRFVREIFKKYGNSMPKAPCIQHFDRYIKIICKKVGFDEDVLWERTIGNDVVRKTCKKYELVGSHTARRSFATNAFFIWNTSIQNHVNYRT